MHLTRTRALLLAASAALPCLPASGVAQGDGDLLVRLARTRFATHRATDTPRDSLEIRGRFPSPAVLRTFDPNLDALRVTVAGVEVLSVPAATDADGFRFRPRGLPVRKWRYRVRGERGAVGVRTFFANASSGRITLEIKRADLRLLRAVGAGATTVAVTIGDTTAEAGFSFRVVRPDAPERWVYRNPAPPPPPLPVPLTFTSLVASSLPNTPWPHVETACTQQEFDALWPTLGNLGPQPEVDFSQDMVVVVSSLVHGPGAFPPILDVVAVRDRGFMEIDWRLALCEENVCPGAPIPCPTATPFHVFTTRRYDGIVRTVQQSTIGVCP